MPPDALSVIFLEEKIEVSMNRQKKKRKEVKTRKKRYRKLKTPRDSLNYNKSDT